jgi:hypothetical protein
MTIADITPVAVTGSTIAPRPADTIALSQAVSGIPSHVGLYDPSRLRGYGLRNRMALASGIVTPGVNMPTIGTIGGRAAVVTPEGTTVQRLLGDVAVNPNAWTVYAVIQIAGNASGVRDIVRPETVDTVNLPLLRLGISTGNVLQVMRNTGAGVRLAAPSALPLGQPVMVVATFSTDRGLSLRVNGVEVVRNEGDVTPLHSQFAAGQYHWTRQLLGSTEMLFGIFGVVNADLSDGDNVGALIRLERGLMEWHGMRYTVIRP